jgi:hypothetical protein
MSGYKENQAQAAQMFAERKRDMIESASTFAKPGDENSKYYTKPDEPPISHPAEVLERLQKEKPDTPMEELVKEADATVAKEIEERKEKREAEAKEALEKEAADKGFNSVEAMQKFEKEKSESSTEAQDTKGEGEVEEGEEVESK